MDVKLADYRARKRREHFISETKGRIVSIFKRMRDDTEVTETNTILEVDHLEHEDDHTSISSDVESIDETQCCDEMTYSKLSLYASLWLILFSFAVYLEFGAVFFVISGLYIVWANTRTGPKKRGEISAYSVFNPNCEAIDGTLNAEQFEKELRYGAL